MDMLIDFIARHAPDAHWWVFFLLMLAGINLPISEDILIVMSAVLAATAIPGSPLKMFIFVFLGCYLSDWVSYGIGRNLIPRLKGKKWAGKLADNKQMLKVSAFYAKYSFDRSFYSLRHTEFFVYVGRNGRRSLSEIFACGRCSLFSFQYDFILCLLCIG